MYRSLFDAVAVARLQELREVVLRVTLTADDPGVDRDPVRPDRHFVLVTQGVDSLLRDGVAS